MINLITHSRTNFIYNLLVLMKISPKKNYLKKNTNKYYILTHYGHHSRKYINSFSIEFFKIIKHKI